MPGGGSAQMGNRVAKRKKYAMGRQLSSAMLDRANERQPAFKEVRSDDVTQRVETKEEEGSLKAARNNVGFIC